MSGKMVTLTEEQLSKKIDFIERYKLSNNAADGSDVDANANVSHKNIATLEAEINKDINIQINQKLIYNKICEIYNKELADEFIRQINDHEVYLHDASALRPYCVSISMYPFLLDGMIPLGGDSKAPQHMESFCGSFINLVFAISAQFAGAIATVEFLMMFDYFARKDYGKNYLKTHKDKVANHLQHVVYALNQPAAARGYQSCFWNISIFDKNYFESIFENFYFPDGTVPEYESISKLQDFFMDWFNRERTKAILSFPVVTAAMLTDEETKKPVDMQFARMCAKEMSRGNSFFIYMSDSADSLASCCFDGSQKVLTKSSSGINYMSFEEFHEARWKDIKKNLTIFHNGSWVSGKSIKLDGESKRMFKVTTANNKEIIVTDDHLNPTINGDKYSDKLTHDDYLLFNNLALDAVPEKDELLTYEQGVLIGAFLGDGSFGGRVTLSNGAVKVYESSFSLNKDCYDELKKNIDIASKQCGSKNELKLGPIYNNVYPCRISSQEVVSFIKRWVNGYKHNTKSLNLNCLLQSKEFRQGILDGLYLTDGGNSNRVYTVSNQLREDIEVLLTSLGYNSIINTSDRTDEKVVIRGKEYNRNYPLHCIRWYNSKNKRSMKDIYVVKNNSVYFKVKSIEELPSADNVYCFEMKNQNEPYFTLPNGIITHNCRLRNEFSDNTFSYTLGAGGVATGSINVITLNMNRFVQNCYRRFDEIPETDDLDLFIESELYFQIKKMQQYQVAYRRVVEEYLEAHLLTVYDAGFINLDKQFLTLGINGMVEAAEFCGIPAKNTPEYKEFVSSKLKVIFDANKAMSKETGYKFNTEFVPAENLGVKFAKWDKEDGYFVPRACYNSYFYAVEDTEINVLDKLILHGKEIVGFLDGGSALHFNLEEHLTEEGFMKLYEAAAIAGTNYFTYNVLSTCCDKCGYIDKRTLSACSKCGSTDIDYATRIIGYLKKISSFSEGRRNESDIRYRHPDEFQEKKEVIEPHCKDGVCYF